MEPFALHLFFHGELGWFLSRRNRKKELHLVRDRRASIKDIVESLGVPHTEVGQIICDGTPVDFHRIPTQDCRFDIHPVDPPLDVTGPTLLRPESWDGIRFLVDDNVGRLTGLLRAVGLDARHAKGASDTTLADISETERRILLSRDMELLKRQKIHFGRFIRTTHPYRQLKEVLTFFGLDGPYALFSRCLLCNLALEPISKATVLHRLKPETRQYVATFYTCPSCRKLFWHGPHCNRMLNKMAEVGIPIAPAQPGDSRPNGSHHK